MPFSVDGKYSYLSTKRSGNVFKLAFFINHFQRPERPYLYYFSNYYNNYPLFNILNYLSVKIQVQK
jgi:hypothetical protein